MKTAQDSHEHPAHPRHQDEPPSNGLRDDALATVTFILLFIAPLVVIALLEGAGFGN